MGTDERKESLGGVLNGNDSFSSGIRIILASKSPRRIEIFRNHGIDPVIIPADVDEALPEGIGMTEAPEMLASLKAKTCYDTVRSGKSGIDCSNLSGCYIIGADTIVWKDEIMGKPEDRNDASRMLHKIRGTVHYVVTGVCIIDVDSGDTAVFSDITEVWCKDYSEDDINGYLALEEPYDKAGSYAIQGYFGRYIDHINGDYENVVGLPFYRIIPAIQGMRV